MAMVRFMMSFFRWNHRPTCCDAVGPPARRKRVLLWDTRAGGARFNPLCRDLNALLLVGVSLVKRGLCALP
jgi:hypothetical protein